MSAWAASGAGIVMIGVCAIVMHRLRRVPLSQGGMGQWAHPVLMRLIIAGMYLGGCTVALTALGRYVIAAETWVTGLAGAGADGPGRTVAVLAGVFLLLAVLAGIIWVPGPDIAWMALALPFVAALSGGHLHGVLTLFPADQLARQVAAWIGG